MPVQSATTTYPQSDAEQQRKQQRAARETAARNRLHTAAARKAHRVRIRKIILVCLIVALCVLLAAFVGDEHYQATAVGWLPLFVVLTSIVIAFCYLQVLKRGLVFEEGSQVADCHRTEDVPFEVRFVNRTPLLFFRIEAYFYISDMFGAIDSENMTTLALRPFEDYTLGFSARFEHIGNYTAGLDRVVVSDFLQLFTATIYNDTRHQVQVLPRIQQIERIEFTDDAEVESPNPLKSVLADSMDYAYVRPYVPGDPIKNIHWKVSARTENYMTRLFEVYTDPGVTIVLDFYTPAKNPRAAMGLFDVVVEVGFSVATYAREQGLEAEVMFVDRFGNRHRLESWRDEELADAVAAMPSASNKDERKVDAIKLWEEQVASQYGQSNLVMCSANVGHDMVSAVLDARVRGRCPILFAAVPNSLVGRELEDWTCDLERLASVGVAYQVLARSEQVSEGGAR